MALMMSFAQLLLKKSTLWLYGFWFCVYYEAVLLWQMPWAWITFWVSTWGTRETTQDTKRKRRKEMRKQKRQSLKEEQALNRSGTPSAEKSVSGRDRTGSAERTMKR